MAEREWTPDQKNAIEARGGMLLVSAAAGSGKTAVLVERVVQRLLDPINGCDADRLLVVTFTKAAAAEMRERISAALSARLAARPDDARLLRQQMLLPAHIRQRFGTQALRKWFIHGGFSFPARKALFI